MRFNAQHSTFLFFPHLRRDYSPPIMQHTGLMHARHRVTLIRVLLLSSTVALSSPRAADRPQWGQRFCRNQVSAETGLPADFDPKTGRNIKWQIPLGSECYSTPVVSGGKVFLGVNNAAPRDPKHQGDRGVLFCVNESDGSFCWQLVVPKLTASIYLDWPRAGICSPATVEGKRVYIVSNRGEVMCLDIDGQANGNDGPYRDEARHMTLPEQDPLPLGETDADILWLYDLVAQSGIHPHDSAHCSILLRGQHLYVNTSNGLDTKHSAPGAPNAPSLVVLDKTTGRLIAQDAEGIGPRIFHNTWSSPALGRIDGEERVFFCGGDGVCYGFEPVNMSGEENEPVSLRRLWRFDPDPTSPKENVHDYFRNRRESPSTIMGMPVFHDGRIYVAAGGDIWWGKRKAWLHCIDATGSGDTTESAGVWSYEVKNHCCATPSVRDGLAYVVDYGRTLHCVDVATGEACWTHDVEGKSYGSTLVADGKVYVGTLNSKLWVLAAGREKRVLSQVQLDSPTSSTPVAANGVLYIATFKRLYAVAGD